MNSFLKSIRVRLTLWYAAALTALILLFSAVLYHFVDVRLKHLMKKDLERDMETIEKVVREGTDEVQEYGSHFPDMLFQVAQPTTGTYKSPGWLHEKLNRAKRTRTIDRSTVKVVIGHDPFFVMKKKIRFSDQERIVEVARDAEHIDQILSTLRLYAVFSIPGSLLLAGCGGYLLSRKMLAPIGSMAAKAKEITAERLEERLPVVNPEDEIGQMAVVFNETLQRLHASFDNLRRFTSDASHELRTPLTAIRSVGEVALQKRLSPKGYRDVIGSMLEEVARLSLLVEHLLMLTRSDNGQIALKCERISLDALAKEAVEDLRVLAEEKIQSLSFKSAFPVPVCIDRQTIRQALVNLIDNAIRYTPKKGSISVSVKTRGQSEAVVEVVDNGIGIPEEHLGKIFERFYCVDRGRTRETGGNGLGLSIAQRVVEGNGGHIEVESEKNRGSLFRVVLPILAS